MRKKPFALRHFVDISGSLKLSGGYLSNNEYGENGFCTSIYFQPQLALSGVPVKLSWNIIQAPHGPLQFGRFNLGFSRATFKNYLKQMEVDSTLSLENDSLEEYRSINSQLSDMSYLEQVSNSNIEYRKLRNDSMLGKASAMDEMKMDSLRNVLAEYESLNSRFHQLKNTKTSYQSNIKGEQNPGSKSKEGFDKLQSINNAKGEAKAISDSLNAANELQGLNKVQKIFMRFDKISLGYDVLNHSKLSVMGYPYFGGGADYSYKGLIVGAAVGKHSSYYSTGSFNFSSSMSLPSQFTDKATVVHFKLGLGDEANSSILSLSKFSSPNSQMNSSNYGQKSSGQLLALKTEKKLNENSSIQFEISKALGSEEESSIKSKSVDEIALNLISENKLPKLNANVKMEYLNIGKNFHTPGNPYLSSGFQLLNFCFSKSLLRERVSGDLNLIQSWNTADAENESNWKRFSGSLGLKFKVTRYLNTFWKHFTSSVHTAGTNYTGIQKSSSDQIVFNFIPGKKATISISAFAGNSKRDHVIVSKNYMASSSLSFQHKKNSFNAQYNWYKTITANGLINNSSVSIGDRLTLGKKWTVRLVAGANFSKHNISSILNYGMGYVLGRNLVIDLSGGLNSYYSQEGTVPGYSRFQTMCTVSINF